MNSTLRWQGDTSVSDEIQEEFFDLSSRFHDIASAMEKLRATFRHSSVEYVKAWRLENPEAYAAIQRAYRANRKERLSEEEWSELVARDIARVLAWRAKNPERYRAIQAAYRERNRDKIRARDRNKTPEQRAEKARKMREYRARKKVQSD